MKTIDRILQEFLQEQRNRLKDKTYRDYENVMELFWDYLNMYAPNNLSGEDQEQWETKFEDDEDCYTKMFGVDYLSESDVEEFLDYFIIRKVMSGESFMKLAIRVMKKWSKWLFENNYMDREEYAELKEYFGASNDLPSAEKLSDMIAEHTWATRNMNQSFEDEMEGYFTVVDVKPGEFWVTEAFGGKTTIGPVQVSKQISNICQKGWDINLLIGLSEEKWYILESGHVYPW